MKTIPAIEIRVGHQLYNSNASAEAFRWVRVVRVETMPEYPSTVVIVTVSWQTWKHKDEGVCVRE